MDSPSQEPPERPGPPPAGAESPLSFPVEAAKPPPGDPLALPAEPGVGEPLLPAESGLAAERSGFPAEPGVGEPLPPPGVSGMVGESRAVPAEAAESGLAVERPAEAAKRAGADPLAFPAEAAKPPPGDPLAEVPGAAAAQPVDPAQYPPVPVAEIPGGMPHPTAGFKPAMGLADATEPPTATGPTPAAWSALAPAGLPPATGAPTAARPAPAAIPVLPPPGTGPSRLSRLLLPALTALAALMAAGGCFLPLFRLQPHLDLRQRAFMEAQLTVTQTAWGSRIEVPGQDAADQAATPVGIPIVLAVLLLAVAAVFAFSRPGRGRWLITAAAFFTGGVVATVGMSGLGWSVMSDGENLNVVTGAGMWLLIAATAVAAVAAVLALRSARRRDDWTDPALAYADTPTPPNGVAITVLPPDEPR